MTAPHRLLIRVYYEDTDFSGAVYHARYLHFMERARTDYLRCLGVEQSSLFDSDAEGLAFVVHRMEIDFKSPARMDNILTIRTVTEKAGGATMVLQQAVERDGAPLIAAKVVIGSRTGANHASRSGGQSGARAVRKTATASRKK